MKELLMIVNCDPRTQRAAAEAVRVAAGIGAWEKVIPSLYLHGPAVLCLDEFAEEYPEGHLFRDYLPSILKHGGKVYVEGGNPLLNEITSPVEFHAIQPADLPRLLERFPSTVRV